jgi:hypothetical protein
VSASEKSCPICSHDFAAAAQDGGGQAKRVIRRPIQKVVRRPGEGGEQGDQKQ